MKKIKIEVRKIPSKSFPVGTRLPEELYNKVYDIAKKNRISMCALITKIIEATIDDIDIK